MSNAIEHLSRHRVENTTLQVMADTQQDLARLIEQERSVIRRYARRGTWPHIWVNMFVFEDLQPLVAQIKKIAALPSVVAEDIDRRPMVNVYDAADLTQCTVFVNRGTLVRDGVWHDDLALCALLAHEHGHPLAESETVHAARALAVEVAGECDASPPSIGQILQLLADRLCLHAPQEVFANEIAIRAGFGEALFRLDADAIEKAGQGVHQRPSLVRSLNKQAADGKLNAARVAALLLVGDLQANLGFALEIAPFLRAGHHRQAEILEAALTAGVLSHLDPAAMRLYGAFRDHYQRLKAGFTPGEMKAWCGETTECLAAALREKGLRIRFDLIETRPGGGQPSGKPSESMAALDGLFHRERGSS